MTSQVSFKIDGEHNKAPLISILKNKLKGLKYKIEHENEYVFRVYVASSEDKKKTFNVCYNIQCFSVYDFNREL